MQSGSYAVTISEDEGTDAFELSLRLFLPKRAHHIHVTSLFPLYVSTYRRRAAAPPKPSSTRAAGAGGSSNTMLKLYTDSGEAGLKVDPFVVVVLSLSFIASIFFLHIAAKVVRAITK
ncbi:protein transport protein SEC61 subunit beta, partial [Tremellales sp. Uapishka_1]